MIYNILTCKHVNISAVRNGENVWWNFIPPLASVQFGATVGVYGKSFVRIDSNTEQTGICLNILIFSILISLSILTNESKYNRSDKRHLLYYFH